MSYRVGSRPAAHWPPNVLRALTALQAALERLQKVQARMGSTVYGPLVQEALRDVEDARATLDEALVGEVLL